MSSARSLLPFVIWAGRAHLRPDDSADPAATREELIAKGVEWSIVVARAGDCCCRRRSALTIPMALLLGILVGFGRLSADREFVAMQACGVSLLRLLRPVALVAVLGTAATAYVMIVALPDANQAFREITFNVMARRASRATSSRACSSRTSRNRVIYVRDVPPAAAGATCSSPTPSAAGYRRRSTSRARGGSVLDREKQLVQLELVDGTSHTTSMRRPEESYEPTRVRAARSSLRSGTRCSSGPPPKGTPEMTIAELRTSDRGATRRAASQAYSQRFMIQQKFSLPLACPILALIGLALGASNHRKDGKLASFVARLRRDLRLLRPALRRRAPSPWAAVCRRKWRAVDPEHRDGRRRRSH